MDVPRDATDLILIARLVDNNGDPVTGVSFNSVFLVVETLSYEDDDWQSVSLVAGSVGTYEASSWAEIGDGEYQFCPADALVVPGRQTLVRVTYYPNNPIYGSINAVGAAGAGGAGGEVDEDAIAAAVAAQLRAYRIAVVSPFSSRTKVLTLVQNKDYTSDSVVGPLQIIIDQPGVAAGDVVRFGVTFSDGDGFEVTGEVVDVDGDLYGQVEIDRSLLSHACDAYARYEFEHISDSGDVSPLLSDQSLILLAAHPN